MKIFLKKTWNMIRNRENIYVIYRNRLIYLFYLNLALFVLVWSTFVVNRTATSVKMKLFWNSCVRCGSVKLHHMCSIWTRSFFPCYFIVNVTASHTVQLTVRVARSAIYWPRRTHCNALTASQSQCRTHSPHRNHRSAVMHVGQIVRKGSVHT